MDSQSKETNKDDNMKLLVKFLKEHKETISKLTKNEIDEIVEKIRCSVAD